MSDISAETGLKWYQLVRHVSSCLLICAILQAIEERNPDLASRLAEQHVLNARSRMRSAFASQVVPDLALDPRPSIETHTKTLRHKGRSQEPESRSQEGAGRMNAEGSIKNGLRDPMGPMRLMGLIGPDS